MVGLKKEELSRDTSPGLLETCYMTASKQWVMRYTHKESPFALQLYMYTYSQVETWAWSNSANIFNS